MRHLFALLLILPACKSHEPAGDVTWHQDVAPIVSENCAGCHTDGGLGAPLIFDSYDEASLIAELMANAVKQGTMPPFHADEAECDNPWGFEHDPRLEQHEIETIVAWAAGGAQEGDPATAAPLVDPVIHSLEGVDAGSFPETSYEVPAVGQLADIFVCVSLDPGLSEDRWLEGVEVVPGDDRVVHHVLIGVDHSGASANKGDSTGRYPCLGGFDVNASLIGGWVPGSVPIEMPAKSAVQVPAGARLVLQMHYHLANEVVPDATGLRLRWADEPPATQAYFTLLGNMPGLHVPPGAKDHVVKYALPLFDDRVPPLSVFMVANHMHYVGTRMRMRVERSGLGPQSDEACLLDTPDWDFDWQQFYYYDAAGHNAPIIYPGDTLHIECTYDNSMDNPGVRQALAEAGKDAPIDVRLGEGSLDEMCLGVFGVVPTESPDNVSHTGQADYTITVNNVPLTCSDAVQAEVNADDGRAFVTSRCSLTLDKVYTVRMTALARSFKDGDVSGPAWIQIEGLTPPAGTSWKGTFEGGKLTGHLEEDYGEFQVEVDFSVQ